MKKSNWILIGITFSFVCLLTGLFIGRNSGDHRAPSGNANETGITATLETNPNHDGKIDINIASVDQLQLLPSIGKELAQRIVNYRTENNGFTSIEELKQVNGIGDKKFEQIKTYIKVGVENEDSGG